MPRKTKAPPPDSSLLMSLDSSGMAFGDYMRSVRKAQGISLRELAKAVNKTPTYISDIEKGNNRPPDKDLLDAILKELHVSEITRVKEKLYDLAALGRDDIPADVKAFVIQNPDVITLLRTISLVPNEEEILNVIITNYFHGGNTDDNQ